jgi:hypothetical protein
MGASGTVARPSKFNANHCQYAENLAMLGATDADLARAFDVAESTINLWKKEHPEFSESLKRGKDEADACVGQRLFQRATGYSHEDCHVSNFQGQITVTPLVKHYPPDTTAAIFWLKNRRPDLWRDKVEVDATVKGDIKITIGGDA